MNPPPYNEYILIKNFNERKNGKRRKEGRKDR
jgi:hypothetical protein